MATRTTTTTDSTERESKSSPSASSGASTSGHPPRARPTSAPAGALAGGVASSYQLRDPWPIYLSHGDGSRVWDVDGNEMIDFHNGFGSMVQGHAHPAIVRAVRDRVELGTHFAAPTEDAIVVAEELCATLRPAALALRQLRLRSDDGRDPHRARVHRARHVDQDLRLLPRPPRLRDGLDRRPVREDRRPGGLRVAAATARASRTRSPSSPSRCRSTTPAAMRAQDRAALRRKAGCRPA